MRIDDIWQGAIGIVLVTVIMPGSILVRWFRQVLYKPSMLTHMFGAAAMIWLVYRIPEHVRTFIFLTPPVGLYLIDRFYLRGNGKRWRFHHLPAGCGYETVKLDDAYMVLAIPAPLLASKSGGYERGIADIFHFNHFPSL